MLVDEVYAIRLPGVHWISDASSNTGQVNIGARSDPDLLHMGPLVRQVYDFCLKYFKQYFF